MKRDDKSFRAIQRKEEQAIHCGLERKIHSLGRTAGNQMIGLAHPCHSSEFRHLCS